MSAKAIFRCFAYENSNDDDQIETQKQNDSNGGEDAPTAAAASRMDDCDEEEKQEDGDEDDNDTTFSLPDLRYGAEDYVMIVELRYDDPLKDDLVGTSVLSGSEELGRFLMNGETDSYQNVLDREGTTVDSCRDISERCLYAFSMVSLAATRACQSLLT